METEKVIVQGDRIYQLREALGMKQREVTERIGISQATLSDTENGKNPYVDAWIVAQLSGLLKTSMEYLMGLTDDPSPLPQTGQTDQTAALLRAFSPRARRALVEFLRTLLEDFADVGISDSQLEHD